MCPFYGCKIIVQRHKMDLERQKTLSGETLKAALTAPIPEPIRSIAERIGIYPSVLQKQYPELYDNTFAKGKRAFEVK